MIELVGWIGFVLLIACGLPQIYRTIRVKDVYGLSFFTNLMWSLGCFFMFLYELLTTAKLPLLLNYIFSGCVAATLVVLIVFYKKK